jgi:hypothetical protein
MAELLAGAAVVQITPGAGLAMAGYGARQGVSAGSHDPLNARVLTLDDGTNRLALAVLDLCYATNELASETRALIASQTGLLPENICVAATHTHSGPALPRDDEGRAFATVTARKVAGAVNQALANARPVTLKLGTADVRTISQNRRDPEGPIETTATVLLAAPPAPATPIATLISYACHATVLEYDNLLYSADFPGAACRAVEAACGGTAVYMQGACGDINPAWMRHDFAEIARVGGLLGAAAARTVHELRPLGEGLHAVNLNWSENTPVAPAPGVLLEGVGLRAARTFVDLPRKPLPPPAELERAYIAMQEEITALAPGDHAGRRALMPRLNTLRMDRLQAERDPATPGQTERVELGAWRIADGLALVLLPGEFFVKTGRSILRQAALPHTLICGYANGYIGYVAEANQFPLCGYEVGRTRFAPEAAALVFDASVRLVKSLF